MSWVRRLSAAVSGLMCLGALGVAVAAVIAPGLLAELPIRPVVENVNALGGRVIVGAVGGMILTIAWLFAGSSGREQTDDRLDATPETVSVDPLTITGGGVERAYRTAIESGDTSAVADPLRDRAVSVERAVAEVDQTTAELRIAEGSWTDDQLAASVVGTEVAIPVVARLRAWLDPQAEAERRLSRVVAALETRIEEADG